MLLLLLVRRDQGVQLQHTMLNTQCLRKIAKTPTFDYDSEFASHSDIICTVWVLKSRLESFIIDNKVSFTV